MGTASATCYLNSYLLIFMIVGAVIGVFVANPSCNLKAFTSFNVDGQYMFPILFVTIACGAVSGFHSLVSSGTASKQIKNEKNMLPVSFGAMLMESMLAIIALIAVASFADGEAAAQGLTTQPQIFAGAIANFLSVVGLPHSLVFTLINLAVSAFALTSLDSVARVGRLSFQEFFLDSDTDEENMSPFLKVVTNKYFATVITLVLAYMLTKVGYAEIWPLFGSANQLLSVLALVACAVFLKKTKRQGCMLWIPMVFMMAVTFTALGMTITKLSKALLSTGLDLGNTLQLVFAVLLLILGVLVAIQGVKKLLETIAFYLGQKLTYDKVLEVLGTVDTEIFSQMLRTILAGDVTGSIRTLETLLNRGKELGQFVTDFTWYLRNLLLVKSADETEELLDVSTENLKLLKEESTMVDDETLIHYIRVLSELSGQLRYAAQKRVLVEVALVKTLQTADGAEPRIRS